MQLTSRGGRFVCIVATGVLGLLVSSASASANAGCPANSPGDPNSPLATFGFSAPVDWVPSTGPASCEVSMQNTFQVAAAATATPVLDSTGSNWVSSVSLTVTDLITGQTLTSCQDSQSGPVTSPPPAGANCSVAQAILDPTTGQPAPRNIDALCSVSGTGSTGDYWCELG